jgi:hypothetical protein
VKLLEEITLFVMQKNETLALNKIVHRKAGYPRSPATSVQHIPEAKVEEQ